MIRESDPLQISSIAASESVGVGICQRLPSRIGIVMGTSMVEFPPLHSQEENKREISKKAAAPRFIPKVLGNVAAANLPSTNQGPSYRINRLLFQAATPYHGGDVLTGEADAASVGSESILCPLVLHSLTNARALSTGKRKSRKRPAAPFDADRDGFVIGGGASVLETEEHARQRGAVILAELLGWAPDAYHVTEPRADGSVAAMCIEKALQRELVFPPVRWITSTVTVRQLSWGMQQKPQQSMIETARWCAEAKGVGRVLMGAGGVTEADHLYLGYSMGFLPPTLTWIPPILCDLDYIPKSAARKQKVQVCMSNAFGVLEDKIPA